MATKIEWADETFNPWWGCEPVSAGCAHCYADTFARRLAMADLWPSGKQIPIGERSHGFRFFDDPHWSEPLKWAQRLPAKLGRRPRIFCASMADVFEERPELDQHRRRLFHLIGETPELDWLVLTKRPDAAKAWMTYWRGRLDEWADDTYTWPLANLWLGVSIENARFTWRADVLREIPAAVRFISAEPLIASLFSSGTKRNPLHLAGIDWVIIGGESGPGARPCQLEHVREIMAACAIEHELSAGAGPAVFVKQLGAKPVDGQPLKLRDGKGGDPDEWPSDLRVRDFPRTLLEAAA